jgi:predicted nucleic acid-binding protein
LFASLDRGDQDHLRCRRLLEEATESLVVPSPVLVEVDYLIRTQVQGGASLLLLDDIVGGAFRVENLEPGDYPRVRELCARYSNPDIGFVAAAVLAIVERLGEDKLATLDHRHFGMMRPRHVDSLRLLPE